MEDKQSKTNAELLQKIYFPVVKAKSGELFNTDFATNISECVYLPEKDKVVNMCSPSYGLVENEEFMKPVADKMDEVFGKGNYTVKVKNIDDRKFFVSFIADTMYQKVTGDDEICPMIDVINSYDGSTRQFLNLSFYRKVC